MSGIADHLEVQGWTPGTEFRSGITDTGPAERLAHGLPACWTSLCITTLSRTIDSARTVIPERVIGVERTQDRTGDLWFASVSMNMTGPKRTIELDGFKATWR